MRAFADLLDSLIYTRSRTGKLRLIANYLRATPDPDRGWAMAALTGALDVPAVKPAMIRALIEARVDPLLYRMSRDFVGDTAETVSLLWPDPLVPVAQAAPPSLDQIIQTLSSAPRSEAPAIMAALLDQLTPTERFALIKMMTGALRVGVSVRLAKTALADAFALEVDAVEEVWHALAPPYTALFDWAEGRTDKPTSDHLPVFRAFMLAHPLGETEVSLADYAAEWKWDGIRVQIVNVAGQTRLYSRGGEDITAAFPDIAGRFSTAGVVDGELMVRGELQGGALAAGGGAASFNALQQRLGRKLVSARMLADYPAFVRLYDILFDGGDDLRALPWTERRKRLLSFYPALDPAAFDVSTVIEAADFAALAEVRAGARDAAIEGVMLKRRDSPYVGGRRVGLWYKWKRNPLIVDCVLMYAQRGSGRRSSFYTDFTFGCWNAAGELLPVGKAYSGISDAEIKLLDQFVRTHSTARFGPVREVEKKLVLEIAFDSIHASKRHKSGVAMRFPRINRIRSDKPANEADTLAALQKLVT